MNTSTLNFTEWKQQQQAELAGASSKTVKRRLVSYRQILSDYLHTRDERDDEYEYLQEALQVLPDDPEDINQYKDQLIAIIDEMLGYNDPNFEESHLRGILGSLASINA
jgi:hypothetical protein